eukprot:gnl/MRDRNA2_/MRDRNA2_94216_c0_seq1.p1 gnl/MRDRNA2_/MRDRNA2_94216_c0~~gnl/MRDRNA2_/MRDRNA2_94216_c0_seq1.p1  ORF type:complete len:173 (-),score=31.46 gnl/MRDRNA2_/MRDRNA2_94216_c0_seq1:165-683(-)
MSSRNSSSRARSPGASLKKSQTSNLKDTDAVDKSKKSEKSEKSTAKVKSSIESSDPYWLMMSGMGGGYLLGSFLHATTHSPVQIMAESYGFAKETGTWFLIIPALAVIMALTKASQNKSSFGISLVIGYMLGAFFADHAGFFAVLGVIFAFCAPIVIAFAIFIPLLMVSTCK